jgi:hypothetical protein
MAKAYKKCNCCGGFAGYWEQHSNRDTGWGMCPECITYVRNRGMSEEEIKDLYGVEGVHWGKSTRDANNTARAIAGWATINPTDNPEAS